MEEVSVKKYKTARIIINIQTIPEVDRETQVGERGGDLESK